MYVSNYKFGSPTNFQCSCVSLNHWVFVPNLENGLGHGKEFMEI